LPVVRPVTLIGLKFPVTDPGAPPSLDEHDAVKLVIALPLLALGVKPTLRFPVAVVVEPDIDVTFTGDAGEPTITGGDGADAGPAPRAFVAVIVHVYVLAVVSPGTVIGLTVAELEPAAPPLADVHAAVKFEIALPLFAPAVKLTMSDPVGVVVEVGLTFTTVGAAGDPTIVATEGCDARLEPTAFLAFTLQVYVFAAVRPDNVIGPDAAEPDPATPPSLETQAAT
jgi:hypothetical protein